MPIPWDLIISNIDLATVVASAAIAVLVAGFASRITRLLAIWIGQYTAFVGLVLAIAVGGRVGYAMGGTMAKENNFNQPGSSIARSRGPASAACWGSPQARWRCPYSSCCSRSRPTRANERVHRGRVRPQPGGNPLGVCQRNCDFASACDEELRHWVEQAIWHPLARKFIATN